MIIPLPYSHSHQFELDQNEPLKFRDNSFKVLVLDVIVQELKFNQSAVITLQLYYVLQLQFAQMH